MVSVQAVGASSGQFSELWSLVGLGAGLDSRPKALLCCCRRPHRGRFLRGAHDRRRVRDSLLGIHVLEPGHEKRVFL